MTAYILSADTRARRSAKELRSILASHSIDLSLGTAQGVIARMLGHADWKSLLATIGAGHSPDDADVPPAERDARWTVQRTALVETGLPESLAEQVRARLGLTGRTESDVDAKVVLIEQDGHFHPARFLETASALTSAIGSNSLVDLMAIMEATENWAGDDDNYRLTPLDREAIDLDTAESLADLSQSMFDGSGQPIDASALTASFAANDVSKETYAGQWDGQAFYVHFGMHALPSPYPGCGIEGCYLRFDAPLKGSPRRIDVTFVASPETSPKLSAWDSSQTLIPYDPFVFALRHVAKSVEARETGEVHLADLLLPDFWDTSETLRDAWLPFLAPALNVAWNAVKAERASSVPVVDVVIRDIYPEQIRKLQRARTDSQRKAAIAAINSDSSLVIRGLGEIPSASLPHPVSRDLAEVRLEEPDAWARAYARMACDVDDDRAWNHSSSGFLREALGLKSVAILKAAQAFDAFLYKPERTFAWAYANVAEGLREQGLLAEAATAAKEVLAHDPNDYVGYAARVVILLALSGDAKKAEALLKKREALMDKGTVLWTKAGLRAIAGHRENLDQSLDLAISHSPSVADRLLNNSQENFLNRRGDNGPEYVIAGMVRGAFASSDGHRAILKAAVSRSRGKEATRTAKDGVRYEIQPYSNAEFDESLNGSRSGYALVPSGKAPKGCVTMRYGAPSYLMGLIAMDPCVSSVEGTPLRMRVESDGRSGTFVPDLKVTSLAGEAWYLHVETSTDPWLAKAAASAFADAGMPLLVVSHDFARTALVSGNGWGEGASRAMKIDPAMGRDMAAIVKGNGGRIPFRKLIEELREFGWMHRDEDIAEMIEGRGDDERSSIFASYAIAKIFKAVREGYVDHDPETSDLGMNGFVHARLAFLDKHDTIRSLAPFAEAGDVATLAGISKRAQDSLRSRRDPTA